MDVYVLAWRWLAQAAAGGLIVLALGSLAARLCPQPVRRARVVVLTLLGGFAVPWLGLLPVAPSWSPGLALPAPVVVSPSSGEVQANPASASINVPRDPVAPVAARERPPQPAERLARAVDREGRAQGSQPARPVPFSWSAIAMVVYAAASAAWAAWWLLGQFLLWRVTRAARAVPPGVREAFRAISGPAGHEVVLLESGTVDLPFTFTWARPVIVLPSELCARANTRELRFCLAHEWSHIERRDARAWNLAAVAGFLLFYQPLYWWLRRQLRLCQDYLADDRAAALESSEDYATYLVRLARGQRTVSILPALGVSDRRSNLYRRVAMVVQDHEPLEHRCRRLWSVAAAGSAAVAIVVASGLKLDAASPRAEPPAQPEPAVVTEAKKPVEGSRTYVCHVTDKDTGKPIAGASVLVRLSLSSDPKTGKQRMLEETRQTTDGEGTFRISITPEQAAERSLFVYVDVNHPGYVKDYGGYGYGMVVKNEKVGERPFFENVRLRPGKAIEGRLVTSEGAPVAGVNINAFCAEPKQKREGHEFGRFTWTKTGADGRFRLDLYPAGPAVFWILPRDYSPETHVLKNDQRGDFGTITLERGNSMSGKVLDAQGRPVAGVYVSADRDRAKEVEETQELSVAADHVRRSVVTAADGTYTIRALPAGRYSVSVNEQGWDPATRDDINDNERRPVPGVFTAQKITIKDGETPEATVIRGLPHVVVEGQMYDSKGNKARGHEADLVGTIDGVFWSGRAEPTIDGAYRWLAPHGLEEASLNFTTNEHTSLKVRKSKGDPLSSGERVRLGTLDHDVRGIEVVRYASPILVVKVATKEGAKPAGASVAAKYTSKEPREGGRRVVKGGELSDCGFEEQEDGRFRSENLLPDDEFTVTAKAKGYAPKAETFTLVEGATREIELVLEKE